MVWSRLPFTRSCQHHTVKRGRRHGRQRKRWEDNIGEWTCLEFAKFQRAMKKREKMEETGCEIVCGAPTTLAVKGYMMMYAAKEQRHVGPK